MTAAIPYLAYAHKDRQTKPRDPVNTRYLAVLLEAAGADLVMTFEVHNVVAFQNSFRCQTVHLDPRNRAGTNLRMVRMDSPGKIRTKFVRP